MEDRHKLAIQTTYIQLIEHCDVRSLIPALLQSEVFTVPMIDKYSYGTDREVKRKLFLDIQKRGPEAFAKLVTALRQTNQNYLANLLDPIVVTTPIGGLPRKPGKVFMLPVDDEAGGDNSQQIQNLAQNMPWDACINVNSVPLNINVIPGIQFFDQENGAVPVYSTHSKNRGAVLIINIIKYNDPIRHKERLGAEVDSRNLHELFLQLGFQMEMYVNLTGEQIREAIRNFKSSPLLSSVDMVFVVIMAHGNLFKGSTNIVGIDEDMVKTDWIEQQLDNANCRVLQGKPKIIMYQTCRGDFPDYGTQKVEMDSAVKFSELPGRTRTLNDILVAHSTIPGFASHRDTMLGTWYISNFCETVMNYAHNMHIEDIFKIVDSKLSTKESAHRSVQTSMYSNLGFKKCYLHPMIYLENGIIKRIDYNRNLLKDKDEEHPQRTWSQGVGEAMKIRNLSLQDIQSRKN